MEDSAGFEGKSGILFLYYKENLKKITRLHLFDIEQEGSMEKISGGGLESQFGRGIMR